MQFIRFAENGGGIFWCFQCPNAKISAWNSLQRWRIVSSLFVPFLYIMRSVSFIRLLIQQQQRSIQAICMVLMDALNRATCLDKFNNIIFVDCIRDVHAKFDKIYNFPSLRDSQAGIPWITVAAIPMNLSIAYKMVCMQRNYTSISVH